MKTRMPLGHRATRWAVWAALGCTSLWVAGCSSDDDTEEPAAAAGSAGTSGGGSGGTAGKAGSGAGGSTAGKGGAGQSQGGAGTGGAGTGGAGAGGAGAGGAGAGGAGAGGVTGCGPVTGDGKVTKGTLIPSPDGFTAIDATPGPDGCSIYMTAADAKGANVFTTTIGGTPTALAMNSPFIFPVGVATTSDGQTLFVADLASIPDPTKTAEGAIYTLSAAGGSPEVFGTTAGMAPRGLVIVKQSGVDTIYFTGIDTDGQPGVFKVPAASGAVTAVAKGAPFVDPGGIAVTAAGHLYVTDHGAAPGGAIIDVSGTTAKLFATKDLYLGSYPGGIALSADESQILVSSVDVKSGSAVTVLNATTGAKETLFNTGLDKANEPGGLHRATGADVFAFVNGASTGGGVFVLTP